MTSKSKKGTAYEKKVFSQLKTSVLFKAVEMGRKIKGRHSEADRQIDVLASTHDGSQVVVDCKDHGRNLDLVKVESFIGFLDDVGAGWGILIASKGFTKAIKNRIKNSNIYMDVMSPSIFEKVFSGNVLAWGRFVFRCGKCKKDTRIPCSDLDFEVVEIEVRNDGAVAYCHSAKWCETCECSNIIEMDFDVWEYPEGITNSVDPAALGGTLIETGHFLIQDHVPPDANE